MLEATEGLPGYANTLARGGGGGDGGNGDDDDGLCLLGETRGLRESNPV